LQDFENFNRKLGCTMVNYPGGVRSYNRYSRRLIRDINTSIPKKSAEKNKQTAFLKQGPIEKQNEQDTTQKQKDVREPVIVKKVDEAPKNEKKLQHKTKNDTKQIDNDKATGEKIENKKYARNLLDKSISETNKTEKITKDTQEETVLSDLGNKRSIKEQMHINKVMHPFTQTKRDSFYTLHESSSKTQPIIQPQNTPKVNYLVI